MVLLRLHKKGVYCLRKQQKSQTIGVVHAFQHGTWDDREADDQHGCRHSEVFHSMALFPNTLTLIFSDHGHKMTPFSCTERGRRELFDPAFFMIVPDDVKEKLGPERMGALITNQKRIFMLYDVHKALMSLHDSQRKDSKDYSVTGIFSEILANRNCADLYMLPLTRC